MTDDAAHVPDESAADASPTESVFAVGSAAPTVSADRERALVGAGRVAAAGGAPPAAMPAPASPRRMDMPTWSFGVPEAAASGDQPDLPIGEVAATPRAPLPLPLLGPVGRRRSPIAVAALSAVSLGVYALVWHRRINREMEEFDPKLHARPGRSTVAVAIPWAIGVLVTLAGAAWLVTNRLGIHPSFASGVVEWQALAMLGGLVTVPYLVLAFPISAVAVVMTLERLRCVEEHVGLTADRQVRAVSTPLLLALPVAGGLAMQTIVQRRLNAIWRLSAPQGRPER